MSRPPLRIVQWFTFCDHACVEAAAQRLSEIHATEIRTFISWADWSRPRSLEWYSFLLSTLSKVPELTILPCLSYTPPHLATKNQSGKQRTSHPPEDLLAYNRFVIEVLGHFGSYFNYVQLWNEPNWNPYWSWDLDPGGEQFAKMIIPAAHSVHGAGKRTALGGTTPLDYAWFAKMEQLGVLEHMDAVGFHFSPSWDNQHRRWQDIPTEIEGLRAMLRGFCCTSEIWLAETGFSTWSEEEEKRSALEDKQIEFFKNTASHPADRFYWYSLFDQHQDTPTDDELNLETARDMTAYHFGMVRSDGTEKPLFRFLKKMPS